MAERDGPHSSRTADVAGEDFLFHLYRGSELLQDNRVHDAKAELEQALAFQPSDPKGQDLLGVVYFRLGLYPRAIAIYEALILTHPEATGPRINLALSYLKTGQPSRARSELERVVEQNPGHSRAWGYLGLAFQRLGDYERASYAFAAGGHDGMARRLLEMAVAGGAPSVRADGLTGTRTTRDSFQEIDRDGAELHADEEVGTGQRASFSTPAADAWPSIEPAPPLPDRDRDATSARPPTMRPPMSLGAFSLPGTRHGSVPAPTSSVPSSQGYHSPAVGPLKAADVVRDSMLVFPRDHSVSLHPSGVVLVQAAASFSCRADAVRSMAHASGHTSAVLPRRTRGRTVDEPFGGPVSPIVEITGKGEFVLGPELHRRLVPMQLDDEPLYLREDALTGFEAGITYENGRLPVGDGDAIAMVQLRGPGSAVASFPVAMTALEITEGRTTSVRAADVLGWLGRVVPRALTSSEAPAGVRGFVAFAGEGMVLVHAAG